MNHILVAISCIDEHIDFPSVCWVKLRQHQIVFLCQSPNGFPLGTILPSSCGIVLREGIS
jgi:hypothetical protein